MVLMIKFHKLKLKQKKSMPRTKGTKNAKFKSGIGLEMFQMLLNVLEREYKELGKAAAGSEAKDAACEEVLNAFKGCVDPKVYTDTKLRTALSNTCIRVSRGRPTGNVHQLLNEILAYKWSSICQVW